MNISYITPFPPRKDGIAEHSEKIVNTIESSGKIITYIYSFKKDGAQRSNQVALMSLVPHDWIKIFQHIKMTKPDILHVQFDISNYMLMIIPLYFLLRKVRKKLNIKLVVTYHEAYRDKELYGFVSSTFYRIFSRTFDRIYTHTKLSENCLINDYHIPPEKIICIPHGAFDFKSKKRNHKELRKRYNLGNRDVVLSFGFIYRTKGIEYLIDAAEIIKKRNKALPAFVVAGQVPKRTGILKIFQVRNEKYLEMLKLKIKEAGLENDFFFVGYVATEEIYSLFTLAKMVALPYTSIDQSGVLNIAIASNTPVIASDIGGLRETLYKKGVLVKPRNGKAIAKKITELLSNENKLLSIRQNYKILSEELRLSKVCSYLCADYEKIYDTQPNLYHITANYLPYLGGLETVANRISLQQAKSGKRVEVITSTIGYDPSYVDEKLPGYNVQRLKALEVQHLPIIWALPLRLLKISRDSILHVHIAQAFLPEIVLLVSMIKRYRVIAHVHLDVLPSGPFGFVFIAYKKTLFPCMLRRTDGVVVFSEKQKKEIHKKYGVALEKITVIPNGVDKRFYHKKTRHLHKKPRLLFVGRLSVQKNLTQLLNALVGISEQFETNIVGDGELKYKLEEWAKNSNIKNVNFLGRKDGKELLDLYRRADIFVLPSEREGMPLVLLEAMAMGLPIVATNVTGNRDLVANGRNGKLVPLNDTKAFQDALLMMANDNELYERMSKESFKIAEQYSWSKVAEQFEKLYKEVSRVQN